MTTTDLQKEKENWQLYVIYTYLKAGGRIYPDDYLVFGFRIQEQVFSYIRYHLRSITTISIDEKSNKHVKLKKQTK